MAKKIDKKGSNEEFVGMNWGRKIYLTPKEKDVIKKQQWTFIKTILWIFGILVGLYILLYLLLS